MADELAQIGAFEFSVRNVQLLSRALRVSQHHAQVGYLQCETLGGVRVLLALASKRHEFWHGAYGCTLDQTGAEALRGLYPLLDEEHELEGDHLSVCLMCMARGEVASRICDWLRED